MLSTLHTLSARELNRIDGTPKRRVWYNYFDSRITYEKSFLARLKYVHHNPVHHGLVHNAELYEWCSAAWFARESSNAFVKTVNSFKIDWLKVYDEYALKARSSPRTPYRVPFGVRRLDAAFKPLRRASCFRVAILKRGPARTLHIVCPLECGGLTPLSNPSAKHPASEWPS